MVRLLLYEKLPLLTLLMGSELPVCCIVLLMSSPHTKEKTYSQTPSTHLSFSKRGRHERSFLLVQGSTATDDPQMYKEQNECMH